MRFISKKGRSLKSYTPFTFTHELPATNHRTFIITEAGIGYNGSLELANRMIDAAVEAGADIVKFQTFKAEKVVSKYALKAEYQKKTTMTDESQFEMIRKLKLDVVSHQTRIDYCKTKNIP